MTSDEIFLTGSSGLVGSAVHNQLFSLGFRVHTISSKKLKKISSFNLEEIISNCCYIVHCAANTDVEACERSPQVAYNDIVALTKKLADAAKAANVKIVYLSSTGVYGDSTNVPHIETENPKPTTVHHKCKFLAENYCLRVNSNALIVRTGWIFGDCAHGKKSFVKGVIESAQARLSQGETYIEANPFQRGSPTFSEDLAYAIGRMLLLGASGIYNCVNIGNVTRLDYVKEILRLTEVDINVVALKTPPKRVAPVAANEAAYNTRLENELGVFLSTWKNSLKLYVDTIHD